MAHTPGPWTVAYDDYGDEWWFGGNGHGQWVVTPAEELNIVMAGHGNDRGDENLRQVAADNARLIAAAPDLLKACRQVHDALVHAGFYIACSQPGMDEAGLLSLRQAVDDCRAALRSAEAVTP